MKKIKKSKFVLRDLDLEVDVSPAAGMEDFGGLPEMDDAARERLRRSLKTGEIARVRSLCNAFPEVLCRITMASSQFVHFAVGDIRMGCALNSIEVLAHNEPEPFCWEEEEVKLLRAHVEMYHCADCRRLLSEKEAKLKSMCV